MVELQAHGLGGSVGSVGGVLVNGAAAGLGALSLTLSLAPPGTQPPAPITQHTLDHIKVSSMSSINRNYYGGEDCCRGLSVN